jgi:toxin-antitoxin system PIN domain toxin
LLVVDVNVLLYATNPSAERHEPAHRWLRQSLNEPASIGFTWLVLLGFLRISTHPSVFERPLSVERALQIAATWTVAPGAAILEPSIRHLAVLSGLLDSTGAGGNLTNDAHLAAIAIEHGAGVCSYDNDFDRFDGLRRHAPD